MDTEYSDSYLDRVPYFFDDMLKNIFIISYLDDFLWKLNLASLNMLLARKSKIIVYLNMKRNIYFFTKIINKYLHYYKNNDQ